MLQIVDLKIEYKKEPLGVDIPNPHIGWALQSDENDTFQTAYRVCVKKDSDVVWDTHKTEDYESAHHFYCGGGLLPTTHYDVFVEVWDNHGNHSQANTYFETGLMGKYAGIWISYRHAPSGVPVFGKVFSIAKSVRQARLYVSALGVYEATLNNKRIGNNILTPGWTSYFHRIEYQTYDVTEQIEKNNTIEFTVANGWFCGTVGYFHRKNHYGSKTAMWAMLDVQFEDGSCKRLITDDSWYVTSKDIVFAEIYDGQITDKTKSEEKHMPVMRMEFPFGGLISQECEPIRITERIAPKQILQTPDGHTVLDFGKNLTGCIEANLHGKRGEKIVLKHAEVLDEHGNLYTKNLRGIKSQDTFVLSGADDTFLPTLTYHGFRYVQIEGPKEIIENGQFTACAFRTDYEETGGFECSHTLVTKLYENIRNSQRGNFTDIPTDCPQRDERLGWTGDAQIFCKTATLNGNVQSFFRKWLKDVNAETDTEKGVPHTVPDIISQYSEDENVSVINQKGTAAWGDVATVLPWMMYMAYGDKHVLAEQYPLMKKWVEFIRGQVGENGLWQSGFQYGDWLALDGDSQLDRRGATDPYFVASAFYAYSVKLLVKAGSTLGYAEAKDYEKLYHSIYKSFQREYFTSSGRFACETQTACILALRFDLCGEYRNRVLQTLVKNIENHGNHLTTGFVGTPYILSVLTENGYHDLAGKIFLQEDFPSWLYQVKMGATTVWERWNAMLPDGSIPDTGMTSFNHYAYGSVGEWIMEKLGGISVSEAGYKTVRIQPMPIEGINWVKAHHKCLYGEIRCEWKLQDKKFFAEVEIPVGVSGEVVLPFGNETVRVSSGIYHFEKYTERRDI